MSTNTPGGCGCGTCPACAASPGPGRRGMVAPDRTHLALKRRLLDAISGEKSLADLSTRADDDAVIALTDAWAASLHVLSFYLERFHTEAYLGTATDMASLTGLAGQVGYSPRPAISATTVLSFTMTTFPDADSYVPVRAGFKVQTIPGPEEAPVTFETSEDVMMRPGWNQLPSKRWAARPPQMADVQVRVKETQIAARPGDILGFILKTDDGAGHDTFELARLSATESRSQGTPPHFILHLDHALQWLDGSPQCRVAVFSRRAAVFGYNASRFEMLDREVRGRVLGRIIALADDLDPANMKWFGLKASRAAYLADTAQTAETDADRIIDLDAVYTEAMIGRYVILKSPDHESLYTITDVAEIARSDFGISAKVTRLVLDRPFTAFNDAVRSTAVLIQTEALHPADSPYQTMQPVTGGQVIELSGPCDLPAGRLVVVQGISATGAPRSEAAIIESSGADFVRFTTPLVHSYIPEDLVILGNAAMATHGETVTTTAAMRPATSKLPIGEILGSGDARKVLQGFALRQSGLTYVSAANALGYEPALEVRVDDVVSPREIRLYGLGTASRAYALEIAPDGRTVVRFANRLRTGQNNVSAVYRAGGGEAGNLAPGRLKTPLGGVLGLRDVTNPVPAEGGTAAESPDHVRGNAALRIVALDRIVSISDYAAFARAYGGVARAQATVLWVEQREIVHVTVVGPGGAAIASGSTLFVNLSKAIAGASPPGRAFRLLAAENVRAFADIALRTDPAYDRKSVEATLRAALVEAFAAERRAFAAPLAKSAILALAHAVPGVVAVRILRLASATETADREILGARGAHIDGTGVHGAEYLTLAATDISLAEFAP